jgi:hypothetical protein
VSDTKGARRTGGAAGHERRLPSRHPRPLRSLPAGSDDRFPGLVRWAGYNARAAMAAKIPGKNLDFSSTSRLWTS